MGNEAFIYRKIVIIGCSGAGKSTLAVALGKRLDIPVIHLDKMWWLPDWQHRTEEEFDELLEKVLLKDSWIIDGDYSRTFAKRLEYADYCIFLDYPPDICLESAYARFEKFKGRSRPDMADGCIELFDAEFEDWIKFYGERNRPNMFKILAASNVPYTVFTDRVQKDLWLKSLR